MPSLFILAAAVLYGGSPILAKVAYAYGVPTLTFLASRSAFAAACLWVGILLTGRRAWPSRGTLAPLVAIGATVIPAQGFAYFLALRYLPASSVSVLAYTYPIHVAWMGRVFLGERIRRDEAAVLLAVVCGALLVAGQTPALRASPGFFAIGMNTILYATYLIAARRMMRDVAPLAAMSVMVPLTAAIYGTAALLAGQTSLAFPVPALLATFGGAAMATLIAPFLMLAGLRATPVARAAILGMLEPVIVVVLSVLLLGDRMTPWRLLGIAIVLSGILVLHLRRSLSA